MYCRRCGSQQHEGSRFCGNCGAQFSEDHGVEPLAERRPGAPPIRRRGTGARSGAVPVIALVALLLVLMGAAGLLQGLLSGLP